MNNKRLKKLSEICEIAPTLQLKVTTFIIYQVLNSSSTLEKGTVININAQGTIMNDYESQLRKAKDGIVYFGYLDKSECTDKVCKLCLNHY